MKSIDMNKSDGIYSVYTEDIQMQKKAKIFSLGNSNAFRFTKEIMQALNLKSNDEVLYEITDNNELVIRKANSNVLHFADFIKGAKPVCGLTEDDFGASVGKEML